MYRLENMEHVPSMNNMLTGSNDCSLKLNSRQTVHTSRLLLVMHSEFLKKCLESVPAGHCEYDIMLPDAPHNIVEKLVEMLSAGEICGTRAELNDIVELAMVLQIRGSESWKYLIIKVERDDVNWHQRAVLSALRLSKNRNREIFYLSTSAQWQLGEISLAPATSSMANNQHQQSSNETAACPSPPRTKKLWNPEHIKTIQKILERSPNDCFFISKRWQKVYTNRLLLAIHSEHLKECLHTRPEGTGPYDIMLPEASHNIVKKLVQVLLDGEICGTKAELDDVVDLAKFLQIRDIESWKYSMK
uniref:BTB domain-containing protein n=1 Tax=Anopheles atroparvus TaxID=41427 RepID=A0AAG5DRJ4_ANOAO